LISDMEFKPRKAAFVNSTLVMVLLMLAIGAGTLMVVARAPRPEIIDTAYVMKPEIPWVSLEGKFGVLKKSGPKGFQPYVPGETLRNGQFFYVKVNIDEPSYVYVFLEQSSGGNISNIFPIPKAAKEPDQPKDAKKDQKADDKSTSLIPDDYQFHPGDIFTQPLGLESNLAGLDNEINRQEDGWLLGGEPGAETFVVLSTHTPITICGNQDAINAFYKKASELLDKYEPISGIEVEADLLKPGLLAVNKDSSGAATQVHQRNTVYLTRLAVRHK